MKKILICICLVMLLTCCTKKQDDKKYFDKLKVVLIDDGTIVGNLIFNKEDDIILNDLTKDGYDFLGWYLDPEYKVKFEETKLEYFLKEEMPVYALWSKKMAKLDLEIYGMIDELCVINPIFIINNYDQSGSYKLFEENNLITEDVITSNLIKLNCLLKFDTNYTFEVSFNEIKLTKTFKTIKDHNDNITNEIVLNNPFMDKMVLQRDTIIDVVGVGPKKMVIEVSFMGQTYYGISDHQGEFIVQLPEQKVSFANQDLIVSCHNVKKVVKDVLVGDVFMFAGQSNMQWPTNKSDYRSEDVENAITSPIRLFAQDVTTSTKEERYVKNGRWFIPSKVTKNFDYFSAIAFMTSSMLGNSLKDVCPIGILTGYQGDTNIANWMSEEYYQGNCKTKYLHYNAMIAPFAGTKLKGVIWYQGCNNSASAGDYEQLLTKLFANYRKIFNNDLLSFYVVGLCSYDGDSGNNYDFSYVREAQAKACAKDDYAYYINTCDGGDPTFIHPTEKRYICQRLTKSILSSLYGFNYLTEGPSYKAHEVIDGKVYISLNNSDGLYALSKIDDLKLAGEDGKYYDAQAYIINDQIVASTPKVKNPVYIKYGFSKSPMVNIFNKDGYSITPFRTDDLNTLIDLFEYDDLTLYTNHPDGSKVDANVINGNLQITKQQDGKGYGSLRLSKWGMIAYDQECFKIKLEGSNSNASISIRMIEGSSNEIWACKVIDDFTGVKEFNFYISDFTCVYNKQDNIFNPQGISYIELMIESYKKVEITLMEARFYRQSTTTLPPTNFIIESVVEKEQDIEVKLSKAMFAQNYLVEVYENIINPTSIIYKEVGNGIFNIPKTNLKEGIPYYINAYAVNDYGQTNANNQNYVFYLKQDQKYVICNFDFPSDEALNNYIATSMKVHNGLKCSMTTDGKALIKSTGQGWQNFIFVIETGANSGFNKLVFDADFTKYHGEVIIQLVDTNYQIFQLTLDLTTKDSGTYELNLTSFMKQAEAFDHRNLIWVSFNFNDTSTGEIVFDNCAFIK